MLYVIDGNPIPLQRARTSYVERRHYDCQKGLKLMAGLSLAAQHGERPMYTGPLRADITFYLPLNKQWSRKASENEGRPHTFRPDTDNCIKFLLDCAAGILYLNDSIIAEINAKKVHSKNPHTEFTLTEITWPIIK